MDIRGAERAARTKEGEMATTSARLSGSGRAWPAVLVVVVVAALAVGVYLWTTGKGQKPAAPALSQAAIDKAIPPLPQADLAARGPKEAEWVEKLRAVCAALPEAKKQEMLATGICSFAVEELSAAQAEVVKGYLLRDDIAKAFIGDPPDFAKLKLSFGRIPEDPGHVRFIIDHGGGRIQPEIGIWPQTSSGR